MAEQCLLDKVTKHSDKDWSVYEDGGRVVVQSEIFKCFISKAYEVKSRKKVLSAHMLLTTNSLSRLQFWSPSSLEQDDAILNTIFQDLRNIKTYCLSIHT